VRLSANNKRRTTLWISKTKRKTRNKLLISNSPVAAVRKVAIRVIVRGVPRVHVFTKHVPIPVREVTIVIRVRTMAVSDRKASDRACRVALPSAEVTAHALIIIMRAVIVPVSSMASRVATSPVSSRAAIVPASSMASNMVTSRENMVISRVAIVPVSSMVSSRENTVSNKVAIVLASSMASRVATNPVSREVTSSVPMVVASGVATTMASNLMAAIVSVHQTTTPMRSTL